MHTLLTLGIRIDNKVTSANIPVPSVAQLLYIIYKYPCDLSNPTVSSVHIPVTSRAQLHHL